MASINVATKGLMLEGGIMVTATLIAAPSSTRDGSGEHGLEARQTKKVNQRHLGAQVQIGVDSESSTVVGKAANVNDVNQGCGSLPGGEIVCFSGADYLGSAKRHKATDVDRDVAIRTGKQRRALDGQMPWGNLLDKTAQGQCAGQSRTSLPGCQMQLRILQGPQSGGWSKTRHTSSRCLG